MLVSNSKPSQTYKYHLLNNNINFLFNPIFQEYVKEIKRRGKAILIEKSMKHERKCILDSINKNLIKNLQIRFE